MADPTRVLAPSVARDPALAVFEDMIAAREDAFNPALLIPNMVDNAPATALFALAQQYSVTGNKGWLLAADDDARRDLIKRSGELNAAIGTPWAIKEALRSIGWSTITIAERVDHWTTFDVRADGPVVASPGLTALTAALINTFRREVSHLRGLLLVSYNATAYFGFSDDIDAAAAGFGDATDPTVGGYFAGIIA
jgi:P2-related tail formation protein